MIRAMFNLRCKHGHQHFSPDPSAFVGRQCFYPTDKNNPTSRKKCTEPLKKIRR